MKHDYISVRKAVTNPATGCLISGEWWMVFKDKIDYVRQSEKAKPTPYTIICISGTEHVFYEDYNSVMRAIEQ